MDLFLYIKNNLPILDVITDFVQVKPAGHYWKGSCIFHAETDASFTVSPDRQIFYCFGCHAAGDVIAFIARVERISQLEAAKVIIDRYGLQIPDHLLKQSLVVANDGEQKEHYFKVHALVAQWCHNYLLANSGALSYVKSRNLTELTLKMYSIGLFPSGFRTLENFVRDLGQQGVLLKDLVEYGIVAEKKHYIYSSFEERIIFPIKDHLGRYCGFGGRIFKPGDERAKYYNSKESEWFVKGKILFGLEAAKKSMQEKKEAFLVEGYMDCLAMAQAGYSNTVATLGTACTSDHLKMLSRYVTTLYVMYDGDQAGQNAILRMTELCWDVNLEMHVIKLPFKEDPASYLAKHNSLGDYQSQSLDIFSFFTKTLCVDFHAKTLAEKLSLSQRLFDVIMKINDPFKQDLLLQQASASMRIPIATLKKSLIGHIKSKKSHDFSDHPVKRMQKENQLQATTMEGGAGNKVSEVEELEKKILYVIIKSLENDKKVVLENLLLPYFSDTTKNILTKLVAQFHDISLIPFLDHFLQQLTDEEKNHVMNAALAFDFVVTDELLGQLQVLFARYHWKYFIKDIRQQIAQAQHDQDTVKVNDLMVTFLRFKQGFAQKGFI